MPHDDQQFIHTLVNVLAVGIAVVAAPYLAGALFGVAVADGAIAAGSVSLASAAEVGLSAGLIDASIQGLAAVAGLDKFSFKQVIATMVTSGAAAYAPAIASGLEVEEGTAGAELFECARVAVNTEVQNLIYGKHQFDVKEVIAAVVANFGAGMISKQVGNSIESVALGTVQSTLSNALILNQNINIENLAAQLLGNVVVNRVGYGLKQSNKTRDDKPIKQIAAELQVEPQFVESIRNDPTSPKFDPAIEEALNTEKEQNTQQKTKPTTYPYTPIDNDIFTEIAQFSQLSYTPIADNIGLEDNNRWSNAQSKNWEEVVSNPMENNNVSVMDQLKYVVNNPYQVTKDFFNAMANPHPIQSNANDGWFTKGVNLFYNQAAQANLELQNDYNNGQYGSVMYDVAEPFAEALLADTVVGIAAPYIKPGLNALASSLGGGANLVDYALNQASEFATPLIEGTAATLGKMGLFPSTRLTMEGVSAATARDVVDFGGGNAVVERLSQGKATEVNAIFESKGMKGPYSDSLRPRTITLNKQRTFVRVHADLNQARAWMMRADEIEGLSPIEIKNKFALPELPKYVSEVYVPAGISLRVGRVAAQKGWGAGGGLQYELLERLPESSFKNMMPLQNIRELGHIIEPYPGWNTIIMRK